MTTDTRDSLLRRILDDPQDDGVRLVYADWLEERGDADRAEFIRVQIRLAAQFGVPRGADQPVVTGDPVTDAEEVRLRRREQELLTVRGMGRDWLGFLPPPLTTWEWSRGFVRVVKMPLEAWTGGVCGRCGGWKYLGAPAPGQHGWIGAPDCPDCAGTGTTPGVGTAVVACHPVEVVRVSDREPYHGGGQWSWYDETKVSLGLHPKSDLPSSVFRLLPRSECGEDNHGVYYPTEAAANAALSAALITMAKVPV